MQGVYSTIENLRDEFPAWRQTHQLEHVQVRAGIDDAFPSIWWSSAGLRAHPDDYIAALLSFLPWVAPDLSSNFRGAILDIGARILPPEFEKDNMIDIEQCDIVREVMKGRGLKIRGEMEAFFELREEFKIL